MKKLKKTTKIAFFFSCYLFFAYMMCASGQNLINQNLVKEWNNNKDNQSVGDGKFRVNNMGQIVYSGQHPPKFAREQVLKTIGINTEKGVGDINPFGFYTHERWKRTSLYHYAMTHGRIDDWQHGKTGKQYGYYLLQELYEGMGPDVIVNMVNENQDLYKNIESRRKSWADFIDNIAPKAIATLTSKKTILLGFLVVLIFVLLPIVMWHLAKSFSNWLFIRRPTILGPHDSNIYGYFFQRWFWSYPKQADAIFNPYLQKQLERIIQENKDVIESGNRSFIDVLFGVEHEQEPYGHILAYGEPGVGKTLFAKNLAEKTGMNFMYLTISDLSQLPQEEAIQTLKQFIAYARKYSPCVFIVDEADILFTDVKAKKLAAIFQREFSKAVDNKVQLFFITNYPELLNDAIINRFSHKLFFSPPNFATKKQLLKQHLAIARKVGGKARIQLRLIDTLEKNDLGGLVGRDIEAIAVQLARNERVGEKTIKATIRRYRKEKEAIAKMKNHKKNNEEENNTTSQNNNKTTTIWSRKQ